jgi:hypothetical protein
MVNANYAYNYTEKSIAFFFEVVFCYVASGDPPVSGSWVLGFTPWKCLFNESNLQDNSTLYNFMIKI